MNLYVVATPIGNLSDASPRMKTMCSLATLVIAEDTRTARKLFSLLSLETNKTFISSHAQSSDAEREKLLEECARHEHIVLVTDAGTPAISDPGSFFINHFRSTFQDAKVVPIPGPSAVIAALSVCGFPASHFEFFGFIPHKKGRKTLFERMQITPHTMACYESPHRILKTLESLTMYMPERMLCVCREMTKQFEEYKVGTAAALYEYYTSNSDKVRGEFVIVISPLP